MYRKKSVWKFAFCPCYALGVKRGRGKPRRRAPYMVEPLRLCVRTLEAVRGVLFTHSEAESMREFAKAFYESPAWRRTRAYILKRDAGLCAHCGEPGVIVHHKIELTPRNIDDPAIALGEDNLETVCRTCHALIHEGTPPLADGLAFDADGNIITAPHPPRGAPK